MKSSDIRASALRQLRGRGYTEDFHLRPDGLYCAAQDLPLTPEQFQVDAVFRFGGLPGPGEASVLMAISATGLPLRGVLLPAYDQNAAPLTADMQARLRLTPRG